MSGASVANNIQAPVSVNVSEPSTWPEEALKVVLAAKYWAPEGPRAWKDETICAIVRFRHPELAAISAAHLVMVWSWMCQPSHGNRFFGFETEHYKRHFLKAMQATCNDIHDEKLLFYLPGTEPKDESSKGPEDLKEPQGDSNQARRKSDTRRHNNSTMSLSKSV